jgi:hypothetical protein
MSFWTRFLGLPQKGELARPRFYPGQHVVCIIRGFWISKETGKRELGPARGDVCTVVGFNKAGFLLLSEYPKIGEVPRPAYDPEQFRPVRETSIDCFTALLEKPPVKQTEDA